MNLYFLVEGDVTEKLVYRAWIKHSFPSITVVETFREMVTDTCYIVSGGGQPQYERRLQPSLLEIKSNPAIDHFFICIDVEEGIYTEKLQYLEAKVAEAENATRVREGNPSFRVYVILQNCCMETWFLGHTAMMRDGSPTRRLREYKKFFDVERDDPELMGAPPLSTRAAFHLEYLQEMMLSQSPRQRYRKRKPGVVLERPYMDALRERTTVTGHLPSLKKLFTAWDAISSPSLAT